MKDWKYFIYVLGAIALFIIVKLMAPRQFDWSVTYAHNDRNPYGTYVLHSLLPGIFENKPIHHSYQTLYELKDSLQADDNIFIITSDFRCGKEDTEALLRHVEQGGTAFISSEHYWGVFADTLQITVRYLYSDIALKKDSAFLKFANHHLDTTRMFYYRGNNIVNYFSRFDKSRTTVIARNRYNHPVSIRVQWGKGFMILNTTPMAFTNIYMLAKDNDDFVSAHLSYLPVAGIQRTEFYHLGRMEAGTPLRFILSSEPLRWGYYITAITLLLFMIFESKRKQRIIPVIKPLPNTSLQFVTTIGNLYYQHGNHKDLAEKKINFLFDYIRTHYRLNTNRIDEPFITAVAAKSGFPIAEVQSLFNLIGFILSSTQISANQLMDLNQRTETFYAVQQPTSKREWIRSGVNGRGWSDSNGKHE